MKKLLLLITLVLVVIAFAVPGQAAASTLTLNFDTVFPTKLEDSPSGNAPWLIAEFVDLSDGDVQLTLTANLQENVGAVYFNLDTNFNPENLTITPQSSPDVEFFRGTNSFNADGDGYFDIKFSFKDNTFDNNDVAIYLIESSDPINAKSFDFWSDADGNPGSAGGEGLYLAAAHIKNTSGPEGGTWIGAVPIPASVLLLGSGLIGVAGFRRKKIAK